MQVRILWYQRVYIDVLLDRSTWTGMVKALSFENEVVLVSGYRHERPSLGLGDRLRYIPSIKIPVLNLLSFAAIAGFRMPVEAERFRADVVIVDPSLVLSAFPAICFARLQRRHRVFILDVRTLPIESGTFRGWWEWAWFDFSMLLAGRLFDGITAITPLMAEAVALRSRRPVSQIGLWSSGVDVKQFVPKERVAVDADRGLRLLYHGALWVTRGLLEAIEAIALLRGKGETTTLRLVGSGRDVEVLKNRVRELGLEDAVSVEPPVPPEDVPLLIQEADAGIVPFPDLECWRASSPLKLIEYMTMALPVIATPLPCNLSVASGSCGVVWAEDSSPEALAFAIRDTQARIAEVRLGADLARAHAAAEFSWERQAERLADYAQCLLAIRAGEHGDR